MSLLTVLLLNRYTWESLLVRHLGALPVFDLLLWTARRAKRRKSLFLGSMMAGAVFVLAISSAFASLDTSL